MDKETKEQLSNGGVLLTLKDYEMRIYASKLINNAVIVQVMRKEKDRNGNHLKFTDEEIDTLIQDLKDLSDWRHYRELMNKLNSE